MASSLPHTFVTTNKVCFSSTSITGPKLEIMSLETRDDDFQERSDAFWAWIHEQPGTIISPKIHLADLREYGQGRGIGKLTSQNVDAGEELFTIPFSSVLSTDTSIFGKEAEQLVSSMEIHTRRVDSLVLTMIHEENKGQDSAWWPYLNILPSTFDTLIYWSPSELEELQASAVRSKIGRNDASQHFRDALLPIMRSGSQHYGRETFTNPGGETRFQDIVHRVASLILSYGFDLDPEAATDVEVELDEAGEEVLKKGMVPLADLCNADGDLNNAHVVQNETSLTAVALKEIKAGEQLYNDFGELPRSDLLRRYGYVSDRYKKWDVVELSLELIEGVVIRRKLLSEEDIEERLAIAEMWNVLDDAYDITWPKGTDDFELPAELVLIVRALLLRSSELEPAKSVQPLIRELFTGTTEMYETLKDVITLRQKDFASTIAEDIILLEAQKLTRRHRMAIEVRLGEKELLAAAFAVVTRILGADTAIGIQAQESNSTSGTIS